MILGPCVGYFLQTITMVQTKSADGFSPFVSFILIVSNLIRVFWWYSERFSLVIFTAAIVMIFCQLGLLYMWVKLQNQRIKDGKYTFPESALSKSSARYKRWSQKVCGELLVLEGVQELLEDVGYCYFGTYNRYGVRSRPGLVLCYSWHAFKRSRSKSETYNISVSFVIVKFFVGTVGCSPVLAELQPWKHCWPRDELDRHVVVR